MSAGYRSHFGSQRFSPRITDRTNKGAELFRSGAYYNPSNLLVSLSIRPLGSALTVDQACLGPAKRGHPLIAQASDGVRPGRDTPNRTRSEESRVGKECVSTCRSRRSPSTKKQNYNNNKRTR